MTATQKHREFLGRLETPRSDVAHLTEQVKRRPALVEALIAGVGSDKARVKFTAAKALRILSEQAPELVYPQFDFLVSLLENQNAILRWNAILTLANLARVDGECKLERILENYLAPIKGPHLIDAGNTIRGAAIIACAKPHLLETLSQKILEVERASYATVECRNVALGHAIRALEQISAALPDKRAVQMFVSRQVNNPRPATRRKAMQFLKSFPVDPLPRSVRLNAA